MIYSEEKRPIIWIIDTSVFCNLLDIPGRNQNRDEVKKMFKEMVAHGDSFLLPYTVILETGNHLGQTQGNRFKIAENFMNIIKDTLEHNAPWEFLTFPGEENFWRWIKDFPESVNSVCP